MAADLGLVADAADRDALELAAERLGDRLAEARLADAGRADEAEDRARRVGLELSHREVLEDAVLDLLEVVVVLVEDLARVVDVEVVLGLGAPRQLDEPLEVGADDAVLGRRGRQLLEPRRARARPPSRRARAAPPRRSGDRSSLISAWRSSPSPSSSWIALSCSRRKYSRWPLSISDWTWDWIFEPSWMTSSSRARISDSRRRRRATSTSSSSSCFSSAEIRSAPAIRCESAEGSSMLVTASCSSSGRYGICSMISAKVVWTLRVSASSSGDSSTTSGSSEIRATR